MSRVFLLLGLLQVAIGHICFGQCLTEKLSLASSGQPTKSSGNPSLDQTIADLVSQFNNLYGTNSQFFFYDDSQDPNAYAAYKDRNIYIGMTLLQQTLKGHTGRSGVAFLIAHEMSHIYQYKTMAENPFMHENKVKKCELQADFMAAYAVGHLGIIQEATYEQMLQHVIESGDAQFFSPDHHGTNSERMSSARWGYSLKSHPMQTVYTSSFKNCCPEIASSVKLTYIFRMNSGHELYVMQGGVVMDNLWPPNKKVAQVANTGNDKMPWAMEFSHEPQLNLYMDNRYQVFNYNGVHVGTLLAANGKPVGSEKLANGYPKSYPELERPYIYPTLEKPAINFDGFAGNFEGTGTAHEKLVVEQPLNELLKINNERLTIEATYVGIEKRETYVFRGTIKAQRLFQEFSYVINAAPLLQDTVGLAAAKEKAFGNDIDAPVLITVSLRPTKTFNILLPEFSCKKIDANNWKFNLVGFSFWNLYGRSIGLFEIGNGTDDCVGGFRSCDDCLNGYETCSVCHGDGHCQSDHYSDKGSGKCPVCGGIGKRKSILPDGTVYYDGPCKSCAGSGNCKYCQGSGKCKYCQGDGKKVCTTCQGLGKISCP